MKTWHTTLLVAVIIGACLFVTAEASNKSTPQQNQPRSRENIPGPYTVLFLAIQNQFENFTATPIDATNSGKWTVEFSKVKEGPNGGGEYRAVMKRESESVSYIVRDTKRRDGDDEVYTLEVRVPGDPPR